MMISNGDGTFTGGPLDVICILRHVKTGRFHVCFCEESPMPGPIKDVQDTDVVRLKSKMHHTEGGATLEEAKEHLVDMRSKLFLPDENIFEEPIEWDGHLGLVWICENWRKTGKTGKLPSVDIQLAIR